MKGKLYLVSVGPGFSELIPPMVKKAIDDSQAIVGYELYLTWIQSWVDGKDIYSPPLTQEKERALKAIELARAGQRVSLISSGDIGIYAMATLAFELMEEDESFDVQVIPGITAANSCASLLGAPLSHDFATLSLSDLLCPWEWIEKRAKHIAMADLAVVFYNVQSRARQDGVYRILDILLEHKSPETWCGVVRNAYREDQEIQHVQLKDLRHQKFDMLTSIVVGNRFTRQRNQFLFTPRGYGGWQDTGASTEELPQKAAWLFSGTSDGNQLAEKVSELGRPLVISTATEYGQSLAEKKLPGVHVVSGRLGKEQRREMLLKAQATEIVDATHPFATEISTQLMELSEELQLPYLRFERPASVEHPSWIMCQTMEEAAQTAVAKGKRVFLTTGSKDLPKFLEASTNGNTNWFVRITPDPQMVERAVELGIPREHICAMQGPFSSAFNELLWTEWKIDCVITKDSGQSGGFEAKAEAAEKLGIPLIVVRRPALRYPQVHQDFESILKYMVS